MDGIEDGLVRHSETLEPTKGRTKSRTRYGGRYAARSMAPDPSPLGVAEGHQMSR